jgi:hypothetical protein
MIMQARIKATGEEIIVEPYGDEFAKILPDGDYEVYTRQELSFPNDEIDLQQVRIQAAIAAMSIVKDAYNIHDDVEQLVQHSVRIVDALIEELKKGGQDGD